MKRIDVKLNVQVVAPLLDQIKAVADELGERLAAPQHLQDLDEDLRTAWQGDLLSGQNGDCRKFLALFDHEFFSGGVIALDEENAAPVLRACAALRLRLRAGELQAMSDEMLESGQPDISKLDPAIQKAFMSYVFLATLQELIIQHLDSALLDG